MCKATSKTFVLRKQDPGTKEVSKVQQGCLESRETEAVKVDLATDPAKGRQGSERLPCRENRAY
jgi:hypothetical protein